MSAFTHSFSKKILAAMILSFAASSAMAVEINLYDQPNATAKTVSKIDLSAGVIPIFTPKNSEWVKVADPRNGNVGWVKSNELHSSGKEGVVFTQKIINDGSGRQSYHVFEYSNQPQKLDPKQREAMIQRMRLQQHNFQREMNEMMNRMNHLYRQQWEMLNAPFPVMMPVIIVPQQPQRKPAQTTPATTTPAKPAATTQTQNNTPVTKPASNPAVPKQANETKQP